MHPPADLVNKAKTASVPPAAQPPAPVSAAANTVPQPQQQDPMKVRE